MSAIWPYVIPFLASLLSLLVGWLLARSNRAYIETKEQREKRERDLKAWQERMEEAAKGRDEKLKETSTTLSHHEQRFTGFQLEIERVGEANTKRCDAIERELQEVPRLRESMAGMQAEVKHIVEGLGKLERKIDKLLERAFQQ